METRKRKAPLSASATDKKTTLRDIARICGVSPMAVSMAINGKPGVSEKTAKRIRDAIRRLKYTPNLVAKSLRVSSTKTIGIVVSDSSHLLFTKLLKVVGDAAETAGYSLIMANTDQNPERERNAIDVLVNKRIDGLLLAAPLLTEDAKIRETVDFGIPVAMVMRHSRLAVDSVCVDNFTGAYRMAGYLAENGGDVYMINLPRGSQSGRERLRGFRRALRDMGRTRDPGQVLHARPQIVDGRRAMDRLIDRGVTEGAVFCGCDLIAIGAMQAARERGIAVPGRFRISGFDDIDMLDQLAVPLTTMRQPIEKMALLAFEMLLGRIADPKKPPRRIVLPSELIVRESA